MNALSVILPMGIRRRAALTTILAVLVTAAAATGIAAAVVVGEGAASAVDQTFANERGPDLVVTSNGRMAEAARSILDSDPRVIETVSPTRSVEATAEVNTGPVPLAVRGLDRAADSRSLNGPVVSSGRLPAEAGEIAFDSAAALDSGISLGDTIRLDGRSGDRSFEVVGLALDFTDCFYPTCDPARAWVIDGVIPMLDSDPDALLVADVSDPVLADAVGRNLTRALGDTEIEYNTWLDTRSDLLAESEFFGAFLAAFGVLSLLASIVVITGIITARTWSRRRVLAQLRFLGCTRAQVASALVVEHLLVAVVGIVVGNLVAALLASRLRVGMLAVIDDAAPPLSRDAVIISTLVVVTVCLLATLVPALRAGRSDLVAHLGAAPDRSAHASLVGRFLGRLRLPVPVDLGARSALARPVRTVLVMAAIALGVSTTIVAVSIDQTMDDLLASPELTGQPADATVETPPGMSSEKIRRTLEGVRQVDSWYQVADTTAVVEERTLHVRAVGGDPHAAGFVIGEGAPLRRPGEAIAGHGLLDATGWRLGQSLHLNIHGRTIDVTLVGWYRETEDSGQLLQIRLEDLMRTDSTAVPQVEVNSSEATAPRQLRRALSRAFGDSSVVTLHEQDEDRLVPFRVALASMAVLVGLVALANVIATALVASRERSRRIGTLRALGMNRRTALGEAAAFVLPPILGALAVGLPLGLIGARMIGDALTTQLGNGPGLVHAPPVAQLATIVTVVALCATTAAVGAARPVVGRPIPELLQES